MGNNKIESLRDAVNFFTEASREAADAYAVAQKWKAKTEAAKAVMWFWVDYEKDQRKAAKAASRSPQNQPEHTVDQSGSKLVATGYIRKVKVQTGSGKRGPWARYGIMLDNEEWFNTFDKMLGEKALAAEGTSNLYELYYTKNAEGYNDLETLFREGAQTETPPNPAAENEQNNHQGHDDDIPF